MKSEFPPSERGGDDEVDDAGGDQRQNTHCLSPTFQQQADKRTCIGQQQQCRCDGVAPGFVGTHRFWPLPAQHVDGGHCHPVENQPGTNHGIRKVVERVLHAF